MVNLLLVIVKFGFAFTNELNPEERTIHFTVKLGFICFIFNSKHIIIYHYLQSPYSVALFPRVYIWIRRQHLLQSDTKASYFINGKYSCDFLPIRNSNHCKYTTLVYSPYTVEQCSSLYDPDRDISLALNSDSMHQIRMFSWNKLKISVLKGKTLLKSGIIKLTKIQIQFFGFGWFFFGTVNCLIFCLLFKVPNLQYIANVPIKREMNSLKTSNNH